MHKSNGTQLGDAVLVIQALRRGPLTPQQIAEQTGVHWRKVYRLVRALEQMGAQVERKEIEHEHPGPGPEGLRLTVSALREWLG